MAPEPSPSRRGVLLGAVGAAVATTGGCGRHVQRETIRPNQLIRYGDHPDQHGTFGLPEGTPAALVVLIHGGFWFKSFGADLMEPAGYDLRQHGLATWNIEYRRTGAGGGWPTTFQDVAKAVDQVSELPLPEGLPVILLGHSAGGHLAVWAASRNARTPGGASAITPAATYSLSGVLDLAVGERDGIGSGAVTYLMGGSATEHPQRYDLGDPRRLVPAKGPVTAFHADNDAFVPITQNTAYVAADTAAGGTAEVVRVPGGHLQMVQPAQPGWQAVRSRVLGDLR